MTTAVREISICAIVTVRNEAHYLNHLLPRLASQRIDVAAIDHDQQAADR